MSDIKRRVSRLEGRRQSGDVVHTGRAFSFQDPLPLDAKEALWQKTMLLEGVNGHKPVTGLKVTVYKKRRFGARCGICTDPVTRQQVISNCRVCGGTGFMENGYYNPIIAYMDFQPVPTSESQTDMGTLTNNRTQASTINTPIYVPGDMIVTPSETHWVVESVDITERFGAILFQYPTMVQMDVGNIEYELYHHLDNIVTD